MLNPYLAIVVSASLLLLTGCGPLQVRDDATGAYATARGGMFELHKEITLRAGRTRAYLQDGAVAAGVNEFRPHCQFEINTLSESPQTVRTDSFVIVRTTTRTDQVVQAAPLLLAALGDIAHRPFDHFDGGDTRRMYAYVFYLHSDRQPDVRALICAGAFDSPWLAELPTLGEIAQSLGDYGTLILQ
jgi:hypothetical protein